jgi:hypothetical protein
MNDFLLLLAGVVLSLATMIGLFIALSYIVADIGSRHDR